MRARLWRLGCGLMLGAGLLGAAAAPPWRHVADIGLGRATARFDYASFDAAAGRLYVADLAHSAVLAIDFGDGRVSRTGGISAVHGVLAIPALHRVFATATGRNEVVAIDEASGRLVARAPAGDYPDGLGFDPKLGELFVSDEHGGTVTVLAAPALTPLRRITIGRNVGNNQYDAVSGRVYVTEGARNELVAIDPARAAVVARWTLLGCRGAHGLLIDPAGRNAFIGCEDNAQLMVVSLASHRVMARFAVGGTPDVLAADWRRGRLYVAGEAGVVSVVADATMAPRLIWQGHFADNAHSVAVDPGRGLVLFPLREVDGRAVLRVMAETR